MKPIFLKEIAKKYTEKFYPEYLSRVDRIWDMIEKMPLPSETSNFSLGDGLAMANSAEPTFQDFMSGVMVFGFAYIPIKDIENVDEEELKNRLEISPLNIETLPHVKEKIKAAVVEMLPSMIGRQPKAPKEDAEEGTPAVSTESVPVNKLEIDKSYFTKNYEIDFYAGAEGQNGKLIIDKTKTIDLSPIENDICRELYNELEKTWGSMPAKDIGWVSHDDFRKSVIIWKKKEQQYKDDNDPDVAVSDETIRKAINRINIKIRTKLGLDRSLDLIENGQPFLWKNNYRFRVNFGHIDYKD